MGPNVCIGVFTTAPNALCASIPLTILIYPNMFGGCVPGEIQATKTAGAVACCQVEAQSPCGALHGGKSVLSHPHPLTISLEGARARQKCIPW